MKSVWQLILLSIIGMNLFGCMSLASLSLTQVPADRNNLVVSQAHDWVFMGIVTQNDFADQAVNDLQKQCRNGRLTGILTKYQMTFYLLAVKREVVASGYCQRSQG